MTAPAAPRHTLVKSVAIGVAVVLVVGAMIGGALLLAGILTPDPKACSDMASAASSSAASDARRVDVVIGVAGNSPAIAAEAQQHVRYALKADEPDAATLVEVTLVNGDREYQPSADPAECIGRALLVAPSAADLESYDSASADAKGDVESALRKQYDTQAELVASAVATAVSQAPLPDTPSSGAFEIWPFVAQIPMNHEGFVMGPFSAGGDNCLTLASPASLAADGSTTAIAERVTQCASAGELSKSSAVALRIQGVGSLTLTGSQRDAQNAVIEALCAHATQTGCVG